MLIAAGFTQVVLAVHIIAVIVAFGVLFLYPLAGLIGARLDPAAAPSLHRLQWAVHMRVNAPALAVVLAAGIYLAAQEHQWGAFYVVWGLAAVVIVGGIGGMFISPREKRLIELSEREPPVTGSGAQWSEEYRALRRRVQVAQLMQLALAVLTIFFMTLRLGGS